jgi:type IV pilus biogenesis protein CpaD/CtpE
MRSTKGLNIVIRQRSDQNYTHAQVSKEIRRVATKLGIKQIKSDRFDMSCFTLGEDVARNLGARFTLEYTDLDFVFDFTHQR